MVKPLTLTQKTEKVLTVRFCPPLPYRSVAQFGSAGDLGSSGRKFESCHSDQALTGKSRYNLLKIFKKAICFHQHIRDEKLSTQGGNALHLYVSVAQMA